MMDDELRVVVRAEYEDAINSLANRVLAEIDQMTAHSIRPKLFSEMAVILLKEKLDNSLNGVVDEHTISEKIKAIEEVLLNNAYNRLNMEHFMCFLSSELDSNDYYIALNNLNNLIREGTRRDWSRPNCPQSTQSDI